MKRNAWFNIIVIIAILSSCAPDNNQQNGVLIKGTIPKKGSTVNETDSFHLDDVAKVLLFSPPSAHNGVIFEVVDMQEGQFEVGANIGTAAALIFLTSNYEYVGNLTINDLNLLPAVTNFSATQKLQKENVAGLQFMVGREKKFNKRSCTTHKTCKVK